MHMIVELNEENFEKETKHGLKLIEFYATWCVYCRNQRIELENFKDSDVWIGIIDGDESPNLVKRFGIIGYPTFVLLKEGEKVEELSGFHEKSKLLSKLIKFLENNKSV